jgi:hypothetical protein
VVVEEYSEEYLEDAGLAYYDYLYFVMTIVSTVGYNNVFEVFLVRAVILSIIIVGGAIIIPQTLDMIMLFSGKSAYSRVSYSIVDKIQHLIITGSITTGAIEDFLREFFHPDHGTNPKHCVIMSTQNPENELLNIIKDPLYDKKVFFIQGNPLDEIDLKRAQAS